MPREIQLCGFECYQIHYIYQTNDVNMQFKVRKQIHLQYFHCFPILLNNMYYECFVYSKILFFYSLLTGLRWKSFPNIQ